MSLTQNACRLDYITTKNSDEKITWALPKPFTIIDIYLCNPCQDEFISLLQENISAKLRITCYKDIRHSPTLLRNIPWLEKKGFIIKKQNEWVNIYQKANNKIVKGLDSFSSYNEAKNTAIISADGIRYVATIKLN